MPAVATTPKMKGAPEGMPELAKRGQRRGAYGEFFALEKTPIHYRDKGRA